jgi:hypothetical protein
MPSRPLFAALQFALLGVGDRASRRKAAMGGKRLRVGWQQAKSEVGWEPVLLLGGVAVVWWSLQTLIDPGTAVDSQPGLQALEAGQRGQYRGFFIAIPGFFGLAAMYAGLTLGVLELLIGLELSRVTDPRPRNRSGRWS